MNNRDNVRINRLNTGNEFVSLPDVLSSNAGVQTVGFVYEAFRACIELHGSEECPLLYPILQVDGADLFENGNIQSSYLSYWIPEFTISNSLVSVELVVFAPLDRRGFAYATTVHNTSASPVKIKLGWHGCWKFTYHAANLSKLMAGAKHACVSNYQLGMKVPVLEYRGHVPLFALAIMPEEPMSVSIGDQTSCSEITELPADFKTNPGEPLYYKLMDEFTLAPDEQRSLAVYVGLGLEEISAIATAEEMKLQGWKQMLESLKSWLDARTIECEDDRLKWLVNVNSFYNYFYSQAITLDTEELTVVSARSAKNESCASYRDRDALLWSIPAVLQVNWSQARRMLLHGFTTQLPNVGVRSRYINGVVLEPGMQLDQLCAPIHALRYYVQVTGDMSVLFDQRVQHGINTIQQTLAALRHPKVQLFETLLLPSGKLSKLPYVCYSNVMVWKALKDLEWLYGIIRDFDRSLEAGELADRIQVAVLQNFVVNGPFGKMFAQCIDLEGNYELGDDPAGSLQLLVYYEFCPPNDPVYRATVEWIHSEHNPNTNGTKSQFPSSCNGKGPSLASIINELLTENSKAAVDFLKTARLDDGIACETIDEASGSALRGKAHASLAGYLAFALSTALQMKLPETAQVSQSQRPSEVLYQPPPPEAGWTPKKARL
ncbi:MAG: glycoside hydrolase family 125 protein [Armatimonadota bacterium]